MHLRKFVSSLITIMLAAQNAAAVDYAVTDEASCDSFQTAIGATVSSNNSNSTCYMEDGTLVATDRLFLTGSIVLRPQNGTFTNLGEIDINVTDFGFYGAGTFVNEGTITIQTSGLNPQNYGTITNRGTFTSVAGIFNGGTITNDCDAVFSGAVGGTPVTDACEDPAYPFSSSDRKCQEEIAKAGAKYFASRHKALAACRSSLMKGVGVFEDEAETTAVTKAANCEDEYKTAGKIAKARAKARQSLEKRCTDPILGTLQACGATIDAVVDATGSTGCLIDAVDAGVDDQIDSEYGY